MILASSNLYLPLFTLKKSGLPFCALKNASSVNSALSKIDLCCGVINTFCVSSDSLSKTSLLGSLPVSLNFATSL